MKKIKHFLTVLKFCCKNMNIPTSVCELLEKVWHFIYVLFLAVVITLVIAGILGIVGVAQIYGLAQILHKVHTLIQANTLKDTIVVGFFITLFEIFIMFGIGTLIRTIKVSWNNAKFDAWFNENAHIIKEINKCNVKTNYYLLYASAKSYDDATAKLKHLLAKAKQYIHNSIG